MNEERSSFERNEYEGMEAPTAEKKAVVPDPPGPTRYCSSASCHAQRETYYAGEDYETQSLAGMQIKVKKGTLCCASCHEPISG